MLVTDGVDVPQAAAVKKARIDGNAARDVGLRKQVRFCLISRGAGSKQAKATWGEGRTAIFRVHGALSTGMALT